MAWTDKARQAAAEARRFRASAKSDTYLRRDAVNLVASAKQKRVAFGHDSLPARRTIKKLMAGRKGLADTLRAIRSGRSFPEASLRIHYPKQAVFSTMVRNLMKGSK